MKTFTVQAPLFFALTCLVSAVSLVPFSDLGGDETVFLFLVGGFIPMLVVAIPVGAGLILSSGAATMGVGGRGSRGLVTFGVLVGVVCGLEVVGVGLPGLAAALAGRTEWLQGPVFSATMWWVFQFASGLMSLNAVALVWRSRQEPEAPDTLRTVPIRPVPGYHFDGERDHRIDPYAGGRGGPADRTDQADGNGPIA